MSSNGGPISHFYTVGSDAEKDRLPSLGAYTGTAGQKLMYLDLL